MTPKCYEKVYKNDTLSRVTPNMKNCVLIAQAAADGGTSDPENREKKQKKRPANQHSPRTRFCLKKLQKMWLNWSPKMTPLVLGNHILHTFWTLGLRATQKVCTKLPKETPGTPNGHPKVPKGCENGTPE